MSNAGSAPSGIPALLDAIEAAATSMRHMAETVGRLEASIDALQSEHQALRAALFEAVAAAETAATSARAAHEHAAQAEARAVNLKANVDRLASALATAIKDHRSIADALVAGFGRLPALDR